MELRDSGVWRNSPTRNVTLTAVTTIQTTTMAVATAAA